MAKGAATDIQLGTLHAAVAEIMLGTLKAYREADKLHMTVNEEDGTVTVTVSEPSPAFLSAVTKFLKDNDITCQIEDSGELSELQKTLKEKKKRGQTPIALVPVADEEVA